jgi:hypothetical protein
MKKTIIFFLILIVGVGHTYAQLPKWALDLGKRSERRDSTIVPLITYLDAVQPALSIIRQQYRLERNGDFFGRQNKPYFAETYSLGVKISGGTLMHRSVIFPWENDADYQRINGSGKYNPTYFFSMQRPIAEDEWKAVDLELGTQYVTALSSDSLVYKHTDATADFGLPTDETTGLKQGYMIWVYSTSNLKDSAMQVKFQQSELTIEAKTDGKTVSVKPDNISNVLGGVFIVPQIERAGYIKLLLEGVAAKNSNGEWSLNLMTAKSGELTKADESGKSNKSRKKKKGRDSETTAVDYDDSELTPIK